jgi:hypothetical protein
MGKPACSGKRKSGAKRFPSKAYMFFAVRHKFMLNLAPDSNKTIEH